MILLEAHCANKVAEATSTVKVEVWVLMFVSDSSLQAVSDENLALLGGTCGRS
jgi:hypothetical protein